MKRAVFIDVDGTLCNPAGQVPASARLAIQKARKNGHHMFICTGRSKPEIIEEITSIGFDGIIGAGGGYIELDGEVKMHKVMPKDKVDEIVAFFDLHGIGYYLESNDGLFGSDNCITIIERAVTKGMDPQSREYEEASQEFDWFHKLLDRTKGIVPDYGNVNKISFINIDVPFERITAQFGEELELYRSTVPQFGVNSGEIAVKGINKKGAVEQVQEVIGIGKEQSMAYGDGDNDLAMFEAVGYCVAMENATDNLKKQADEITAVADDDGLFQSFSSNHLI